MVLLLLLHFRLGFSTGRIYLFVQDMLYFPLTITHIIDRISGFWRP